MAAEEEMAADAAEATNLEAADGSQRQQMERWSDGAEAADAGMEADAEVAAEAADAEMTADAGMAAQEEIMMAARGSRCSRGSKDSKLITLPGSK